MLKIKMEPADDGEPPPTPTLDDDYGGTVGKSNIKTEMKQEKELIIEPEFAWLPTKLEDEQQEYYQHNDDGDCDDNNEEDEEDYILPTSNDDMEHHHHQFSIEYLDDTLDDSNSNDIVGGYDYDKYDENYDDDSQHFHDMDVTDYTHNHDDNDNDDDENKEDCNDNEMPGSSNSKAICQNTFSKWLNGTHILYSCTICNGKFKNHVKFGGHINKEHQDLIEEKKSNYHITDRSRAICKLCSKQFNIDFSLIMHSLRHSSRETLKIVVCNVCNWKATKQNYVKDHIIKEHPDIMEQFKKENIDIKNKLFICPCCPAKFGRYVSIRYHFMEKHPKEHWERFKYRCHLCHMMKYVFKKEHDFNNHLLEEHNFKDWTLMRFIKLTECPDENLYCCLTCWKIFTQFDINTFLHHYLEHDSAITWQCKFCNKKIPFNKYTHYHMCTKMFKKLQERPKKKELKYDDNKPSSSASGINNKLVKKHLTNWQEFEEYMLHICPFCNKEFNKLSNWQMHLRNLHEIHTLKGLDMETVDVKEDQEETGGHKLRCKICNTLVVNSTVELHTHRFQHLPYKPYKCKHCPKSLKNYKNALAHVLNKCQDTLAIAKNQFSLATQTIRDSYEIICPLCNNQKFHDSEEIVKHFEETHNNFLDYYTQQFDNSWMCNICKTNFAICDKKICLTHFTQHLVQKPYNCRKCFHSSITYKNMKAHLNNAHWTKPIVGPGKNPNKNDQQKKSFKNNIPGYHGDGDMSTAANKSKSVIACFTEKSTIFHEFIEFISYACPECNQSLLNLQSWHDHISSQHNFFDRDNLVLSNPEDGSLKCHHCELKMVTSIVHQQKHKLTHMPHRAFICNLCYHRCNSLGVLYGHLRRIHFSKGSFGCPICPEISATRYESSEHVKKNHPQSEWPKNMCLICYKTLAKNSSIATHMLSHDPDRPKFECEICAARICDMKDFKLHMARHGMPLEEFKVNKEKETELITPDGEENNATQTSDNNSKTLQKSITDNVVVEMKGKNKKRKSTSKSSGSTKKQLKIKTELHSEDSEDQSYTPNRYKKKLKKSSKINKKSKKSMDFKTTDEEDEEQETTTNETSILDINCVKTEEISDSDDSKTPLKYYVTNKNCLQINDDNDDDEKQDINTYSTAELHNKTDKKFSSTKKKLVT